jgi:heme oxygenase
VSVPGKSFEAETNARTGLACSERTFCQTAETRGVMDATADGLSLVRDATRERHQLLDQTDWFSNAIQDFNTYSDHIATLEAFYREAESSLRPFAEALTVRGFDPVGRRKGEALAAELVELSAYTKVAPDLSGAFPTLPNFSAAVGCIYVLEGSTLGGLILAGRIRDRLGWDSRFYGIYGARTGEMWRSFKAALEAARAEVDAASLATAAQSVFDAFAQHVANVREPLCPDMGRP